MRSKNDRTFFILKESLKYFLDPEKQKNPT